MGWWTTGDVAEFIAAVGEYLWRERARNTVILTVSEELRVNPDRYSGYSSYSSPAAGSAASQPLLGWWTDQAGAVDGAFLHTPPHPLLLTAVSSDVAAELARTLRGRPVSGVNGYADAAESFAASWQAAAPGGRVTVERRLRLYRLGDLVAPEPAADGAARVATDADAALATDWFTAFAAEARDPEAREDQAIAVRDRLSHQGIVLWAAGGRPVSLAAVTRQVVGMIRVGTVYTPRELRGHGYASAVTAEVSRRAREAGADEVLLYADLANPTSNSIFRNIGYRPVEDRVVLAFSAG